MVEYRHVQPGYVTGGGTAAAALLTAKLLAKGGAGAAAVVPALALLGGAAVLFSSMTVEVRDGTLRSFFGPGLIPAKTVRVRDIASVRTVRSPWYAGWGIRITPRGMLYNVSGRDAVEVRMKKGTRFFLGTDEPEALREAIEQAMREA